MFSIDEIRPWWFTFLFLGLRATFSGAASKVVKVSSDDKSRLLGTKDDSTFGLSWVSAYAVYCALCDLRDGKKIGSFGVSKLPPCKPFDLGPDDCHEEEPDDDDDGDEVKCWEKPKKNEDEEDDEEDDDDKLRVVLCVLQGVFPLIFKWESNADGKNKFCSSERRSVAELKSLLSKESGVDFNSEWEAWKQIASNECSGFATIDAADLNDLNDDDWKIFDHLLHFLSCEWMDENSKSCALTLASKVSASFAVDRARKEKSWAEGDKTFLEEHVKKLSARADQEYAALDDWRLRLRKEDENLKAMKEKLKAMKSPAANVSEEFKKKCAEFEKKRANYRKNSDDYNTSGEKYTELVKKYETAQKELKDAEKRYETAQKMYETAQKKLEDATAKESKKRLRVVQTDSSTPATLENDSNPPSGSGKRLCF